MQEAYQDLSGSYRELQLSTISVANQGLFSAVKDFNRDAVEKAIEIKKGSPDMTEEELLAAQEFKQPKQSPRKT